MSRRSHRRRPDTLRGAGNPTVRVSWSQRCRDTPNSRGMSETRTAPRLTSRMMFDDSGMAGIYDRASARKRTAADGRASTVVAPACRSSHLRSYAPFMAKTTATRSYRGIASTPPTWDELHDMIVTLWGSDVDGLPFYPAVIGGVSARWTDAEGNQHRVDDLCAMGEAYKEHLTANVTISGHIDDGPNITLSFQPQSFARPWTEPRPVIDAGITASSAEAAGNLIDVVRRLFPLREETLFVSYTGREDERWAEAVVALLRDRVPSNVHVFQAPRGIETGGDPNRVLDGALATSRALIALCSPRSAGKDWLAWEASSVRTSGGRVLPIVSGISPTDFGGPLMAFAEARRGWRRDEVDEAFREAVTTVGGTWHALTGPEWETMGQFIGEP